MFVRDEDLGKVDWSVMGLACRRTSAVCRSRLHTVASSPREGTQSTHYECAALLQLGF